MSYRGMTKADQLQVAGYLVLMILFNVATAVFLLSTAWPWGFVIWLILCFCGKSVPPGALARQYYGLSLSSMHPGIWDLIFHWLHQSTYSQQEVPSMSSLWRKGLGRDPGKSGLEECKNWFSMPLISMVAANYYQSEISRFKLHDNTFTEESPIYNTIWNLLPAKRSERQGKVKSPITYYPIPNSFPTLHHKVSEASAEWDSLFTFHYLHLW